MKKKYYAVIEGRIPGVYKTWEECEKQTKGFPNATFKSFTSVQSAHQYLNSSVALGTKKPVDVQLYVDGSWNGDVGRYGWGFYLSVNGKSVSSGYGGGENSKYVSSHQIAGEVIAVLQGLERAVYKGYSCVEIVYDYNGIEKWATKEWSAKSDIARGYVFHLDKYREQIDINFTKVESHTGNYFNDKADRLAKKGAKGK